MNGRICEVHGEWCANGVCRWCEPSEPVSLPGLKGLWQKPERIEVNEAGVPTYTFTFAGEDAIAVHWALDFTPAICPEDLIAACEAELAAKHAALRWERVARRWAAKGTAAEHRMTVEGELAFDDHCAECRRLALGGRPL